MVSCVPIERFFRERYTDFVNFANEPTVGAFVRLARIEQSWSCRKRGHDVLIHRIYSPAMLLLEGNLVTKLNSLYARFYDAFVTLSAFLNPEHGSGLVARFAIPRRPIFRARETEGRARRWETTVTNLECEGS